MTEPIRILLVDDHEVVRQGVRAFFDVQEGFEVIGEAESGATAVKLVEEFVPDVVLMDLIMPGMDGVEATRLVKNISPRTSIVVLTSYHEDEHIFPALQAGALSYILKDVKMDELADAVTKAAKGEATLAPRVASRVIQELHGSGKVGYNLATDLTKREMPVLIGRRFVAYAKPGRSYGAAGPLQRYGVISPGLTTDFDLPFQGACEQYIEQAAPG